MPPVDDRCSDRMTRTRLRQNVGIGDWFPSQGKRKLTNFSPWRALAGGALLFLVGCPLLGPSLNTPEDYLTWVYENIEYEVTDGILFQPAALTLTLGYGDCGDMSVLLATLIERNLHTDADLILGRARPFATHIPQNHAWVRVGADNLDPAAGEIRNWLETVYEIYRIEEVW